MNKALITVLLFLMLAAVPAVTPAQDSGQDESSPAWTPVLSGRDYFPETFLAIDKSAQTFFMLSRKSPLRVMDTYPCTTGQMIGDKLVQGDLRTPEGVYFVGYQVPRGLDWELFGDMAFTLNYPNPVDRLKGKTGSGIWIHGRGKELVPRDTRGCVALANLDIHAVAPNLAPGTPVVIAPSLTINELAEAEDAAQAEAMAQLVRDWAAHWQAKSDDFFSLYDPEAFATTTGENFAGFENHKRSIFAGQPWIQVMVDNIQVAPGPDYWVTWFDQYYRTPGLVSTVGKRLYWMRSDDGSWRIVGREFAPASEDLADKYLASKTGQAQDLVQAWSLAWQQGDLAAYTAFYDDRARQDGRVGPEAIAEYKAGIWAERPPVAVTVHDISVRLHPQGLEASFVQEYEDASGYADKGIKTLILTPAQDGWRIAAETWRGMS